MNSTITPKLIKVLLSFCFPIYALIYKQITFLSLCTMVLKAIRIQDLDIVATTQIELELVDFFCYLVG